mmetsp:Transcript_47862/g.154299  ORF Transcript_47862/g.154299 Transcript_47862/m.154299 type:complete len:270 (+) Transcript_47862:879-1688(+)
MQVFSAFLLPGETRKVANSVSASQLLSHRHTSRSAIWTTWIRESALAATPKSTLTAAGAPLQGCRIVYRQTRSRPASAPFSPLPSPAVPSPRCPCPRPAAASAPVPGRRSTASCAYGGPSPRGTLIMETVTLEEASSTRPLLQNHRWSAELQATVAHGHTSQVPDQGQVLHPTLPSPAGRCCRAAEPVAMQVAAFQQGARPHQRQLRAVVAIATGMSTAGFHRCRRDSATSSSPRMRWPQPQPRHHRRHSHRRRHPPQAMASSSTPLEL